MIEGGEFTQVHDNKRITAVKHLEETMAKYKPTFSNEEILAFIGRHPGVTTSDLRTRYKVTRQAINYRLNILEERGFLSKRLGQGQAPSEWWLAVDLPWRRKIR